MHGDLDLTWTIIPSDLTHNAIYNQIRKFNIEVENALDEHLMFKYNISGEQIKKIIDNTNNFKLKHNNFQKIVQGDFEAWFDDGELFMTVDRANLTLYKRWK